MKLYTIDCKFSKKKTSSKKNTKENSIGSSRIFSLSVHNRAFSRNKGKTDLSFKPRVRLTEGLRKTAMWY